MIALPKNISILILLCVGIIVTSLAVGFNAEPVANIGTLIPIVLIVELFIYAAATFITNSRITIGLTIIVAVVSVLVRAILSIVGFLLGSVVLLNEAQPETALLMCWVGQPVGIAIQVLLMLIATPHIVEMILPSLFGSTEITEAETRKNQKAIQEGKPSGGFIQVFSFDELSGLVRKTQGLEGFLIFSREGFVVWNEVPHKFSVDQVAAVLMSAQQQLNSSLRNSGMTEIKKFVVESRDHLVFVSELNQNFGLILFYNQRTKLSDCENRLSVIDKTVKEFLQWKYPGLSLATPMKAYKS